jgi:chorismate mutase
MQWMRERDQLIEQTRAFVEGIAAARPAPGIAAAPLQQAAKPAAPSRPIELPAMSALAPVASERAEIERRVAKFKAQQQKFQRQREADYHKIFSKTRPTEGNAAHS